VGEKVYKNKKRGRGKEEIPEPGRKNDLEGTSGSDRLTWGQGEGGMGWDV